MYKIYFNDGKYWTFGKILFEDRKSINYICMMDYSKLKKTFRRMAQRELVSCELPQQYTPKVATYLRVYMCSRLGGMSRLTV